MEPCAIAEALLELLPRCPENLRGRPGTGQPGAPSWRATSNPIPLFGPVTRAILFGVLCRLICLPPQVWHLFRLRNRPAGRYRQSEKHAWGAIPVVLASARLKPGSQYLRSARSNQNGPLLPPMIWRRVAHSAVGRLLARCLGTEHPDRRRHDIDYSRNPFQAPA